MAKLGNWGTQSSSGLVIGTRKHRNASHEKIVHGTLLALASVCLRRRFNDVRVTFKLGLLVFLIVAQQSTPVPAGGMAWHGMASSGRARHKGRPMITF
ncbi:hypothetical protein PspLS_07330 [Pyricularia sp. CBS 133598]|nr:hypothetical protein PspLS_07330 [Pyricularia sp. CBS 133598]